MSPRASTPKVKKCYCMAPLLPDGTCRYKCPPEAAPRLLRAAAAKRRKNEQKLNGRGTGELLRTEEMRVAAEPDPNAKLWRSHWTRVKGKRRCWTAGCRGCDRCKPASTNGSTP